MNGLNSPLVAVVTPFFDTEEYLEKCIRSVLLQTYTRFEYVLVDNCSTDRSFDIAHKFATVDPRIRLMRTTKHLTQVQNYNFAVRQISPESQYCKIVQADDWIFPECLEKMIAAAEQNCKVGLVSAYSLKGTAVKGSGLPYGNTVFSGREVCRQTLLSSDFFFGSPTSVLYRSDVVRERDPFFEEGRLHEDTELCLDVLRTWDFAFVHQVLAYQRIDNQGICSYGESVDPHLLDHYIRLKRFGLYYLSQDELQEQLRKLRRLHYQFLAAGIIDRREPAFWRYHAAGLATVGEPLNWLQVARYTVSPLYELAAHPLRTTGRIYRYLARALRARRRTLTPALERRDKESSSTR